MTIEVFSRFKGRQVKSMEKRIDLERLEPAAFQAMFGLEEYLESVALDTRMLNLIKIRASQINHCAFCIDIYADHARQAGETEKRLYAISAWQESPLFTEAERAALAVTEEVTLLANEGLREATYRQALALLGEHGLAQCIMQVVTSNAWSRIAVSTKMQDTAGREKAG